MSSLSLTDSFISYLATELTGVIPVKWVRHDQNDENANVQAYDTLNITILSYPQRGNLEEALVSLDILATNERTALAWVSAIKDTLFERLYTPELDFATEPPASTGLLVSWDRDEIDFDLVGSTARYSHLNATFPIRHVRV